MFDVLTYEKGAAVVRMLEQYLEPELFREGIRDYMRSHQYGNTETTDLWDAIEAGHRRAGAARSWTAGSSRAATRSSPSSSCTTSSVRRPATVRFRQERFRYAGDIGEGDAAAERGAGRHPMGGAADLHASRPATVVTFEKALLDAAEVEIEVELVEPVDWVLANTEGTGFYRVAYERDLREALVARAQTDLSPIERYGLVDDAWAAVLADRMTAVEFLEMALQFTDETDLSVWQRLVGALGSIDRLVDGDAREVLRGQVRDLVGPALARLGRQASPGDSRPRPRAARRAARGRRRAGRTTPSCRPTPAKSSPRSTSAATTPAPDPSLLAAAIGVVAAIGGDAEFDQFHHRFGAAATPQDELRYLYALAGVRPEPSWSTGSWASPSPTRSAPRTRRTSWPGP